MKSMMHLESGTDATIMFYILNLDVLIEIWR